MTAPTVVAINVGTAKPMAGKSGDERDRQAWRAPAALRVRCLGVAR